MADRSLVSGICILNPVASLRHACQENYSTVIDGPMTQGMNLVSRTHCGCPFSTVQKLEGEGFSDNVTRFDMKSTF